MLLKIRIKGNFLLSQKAAPSVYFSSSLSSSFVHFLGPTSVLFKWNFETLPHHCWGITSCQTQLPQSLVPHRKCPMQLVHFRPKTVLFIFEFLNWVSSRVSGFRKWVDLKWHSNHGLLLCCVNVAVPGSLGLPLDFPHCQEAKVLFVFLNQPDV